MSGERILCVDDEPNVLAAYQRILRKAADVQIANGGEEALRMAAAAPPAVILADRHMPGMDGIELLARIAKACPDTVRVMVTGANDQETAIAAINQGNIFRFLSKPVHGDLLVRTVEDGIRQWRLVTGERDLLERTLNGGVQVLVDILGLIDANLFGNADALRADVRHFCRANGTDPWQVELAAMLGPVGRAALPPVVAAKTAAGAPLDAVELDMVQRVPEVGSMLIANIPRLEEVARIILYQDKRFDGGGFPPDSVRGDQIPLGARILFLVTRMRRGERDGRDRQAALAQVAADRGAVDPALLTAAMRCWCGVETAAELKPRRIHSIASWKELRLGMELRSAISSKDGSLLLGEGQTITRAHLERFANFNRVTGIADGPLTVAEAVAVVPVHAGSTP